MAKHKEFTVATECAGLLLRSAKSLATRLTTKTLIYSCGNTSREAPTCLVIRKRSSTMSSLRLNQAT